MVCLTTFGDTKRVISQSLIIFHTFYGYVQGRGVLSRGSAYLPPRLLHTILTPPYLHMGLSLHSQNPACYWSCYALSHIFCDQMPAPEESESNHLLPIAAKTIRYFLNGGQLKTFLVRFGNHFTSDTERKEEKKIDDEIRVGAQAPSAVADWVEACASCSQAANPISEYSVCDIYSNGWEIRII